jgi:hypothetical protein
VTLNKIGTAQNPNPIPTTPTNGITAALKHGPPYGSIVYYVRTAGVDGNGNTVFSSAAVASAVQVMSGQLQNVLVTSVE